MGLGGLSVGLATGINYGEIIESLLEIEQRPVQQLQEKINLNSIKQEAYDELNTLALSARLSMFDLSQNSTFESKLTTSSDENVLTASADSSASVGTHQLRVSQLATASVTLSSGYQDRDTTTLGAGTMSFELGSKRLDRGTDLDDLNDGSGINRGIIRMTTSSGTTENFDLSGAVTVQDALDILNGNTMGLNFQTNRSVDQTTDVREVNGYSIDVVNNGSLDVTLSDLGSGTTLSDLGFNSTASKSIGANVTSTAADQIYFITESSSLSQINDGFGIQTNSSGTNDIRFYVQNTITQSVKSIEADFSDATTVGDVIDTLNQAISDAGMSAFSQVSLSTDGVSIEFSGVVSNFTNINNSKVASDLGLTKIKLDGSVYKSEALVAEMNGSLIRNLNGGNGIRNLETGVFSAQTRRGDTYMINLDQAVSVQDIIRIIGDAEAASQDLTESIASFNSVSGGVLNDNLFSTRGFDESRLIGATITATDGIDNFTATINDFDSAAGSFTLINDNISGAGVNPALGYQVDYEVLSDLSAKITDGGSGLEIIDKSTGDSTFRIDDLNGDVASQLQIESTLTSAAVLFNPINLSTDPDGDFRTSAVFLSKDSLPEDINKDQMIGRSVEHVWSSRTVQTDTDPNAAIESARIVAFEAAGDDLHVSDVDASSSSNLTIDFATDRTTLYAGNEDQITDETNLRSSLNPDVNEELMVGATYKIFTENGEFSSTIIDYDSINGVVTLQDTTISDELTTLAVAAGSTEDAILQSIGYTIEYNHKITLDYDQTPVHITADAAATYGNVGLNTLFDNTNLDPNSTTIDFDRLEGATVTLYDETNNFEYSAVVSSFDTTARTMTFHNVNFTDEFAGIVPAPEVSDDAVIQRYGYYITYPPIKRAASSTLNYLTNTSSDPDQISIVGVGSNESIVGGNLENRILSSFTRLDDLNGGNGIVRGEFSIQTGDDSVTGSPSATIDLDDESIQTIQDLIDEIKSQLSNIEVEINDRGDGIRIYDTSSSVNSALVINDVDGSGTAASLNLIASQSDRFKIDLTSNTDFYSLQGSVDAVGHAAGNASMTVSGFNGLNKEDIIGSKITYLDNNAHGGALVHAYITDYQDNPSAGTSTLTLAGQVLEDGTDVSLTYDASNNTAINLHLKKHQNDFERFGEIIAVGTGSSASGIYTLTIDDASISELSNYEIEQLIGTTITINTSESGSAGDFDESLGMRAMITDYDTVSSAPEVILTIQTHDAKATELASFTGSPPYVVNIAKDNAPKNHIQGGNINIANSFLRDVTNSNFISLTAQVSSGSSTTTIISDDFANLDPSLVVGSLVTISEHTNDTTHEGNIAIVTGYNSKAKAITIENFYDNTGSADPVALQEGDEVHLTFEKEFEGAVLRSEAPGSISVVNDALATTPTITTALTNKKYIHVNDILTFTGASVSEDALIGATVTFDSGTGTTAIQGESRTIVDILHDYDFDDDGNPDVGETVIVLDSELTANPATTDEFDIFFEDIAVTIDSVDFSSGVISTREKMQAAMGNRSVSIHPVVDGSYQKEIEIFGTDTLDDVVDKINAADVGIDASVINDGSGANPYRLSMISSNTGQLGAVTVGTSLQNLDLNIATQAQDAKVILGDPTGASSVISSSNNIITEGIAGVTLNLVSASDSPVTITVDYDREGITETVSTVVDEVNLLLEAANSLIALETEVEITNDDGSTTTETQRGVLFGDVATRTMINDIKFLLTSIVDNVPSGSINTYSDIGIELDSSGDTFEFDDSVLSNVLNTNFDQVKDLFTFTPNLLPGSGLSLSSNFLQTGYDINDIRNGITSDSGFSESGNGSNGAKFSAGDTSKYVTFSLGEVKDLYGFRLHHEIPTDLTARYNVTSASAGAATVATANTIQDTGGLNQSNDFVEDQLLGATITINDSGFAGTKSAIITAYDSATSTLTLDTDFSGTGIDPTQGYTITTTSGGNLSFTHKPIVEYLDASTGNWEIYQSFNQIRDGQFTTVFPGGLRSESIRISYDENNGDSEDFTKNGYFARLLEFEVLESQGLAAQFSRAFSGFTDSNTGSLQFATESLTSENEIYTAQIERLGESILNRQDQLIRQFQNLELVVSNLNSQSSFFQSQINSLPTAFSFRGNNN